MITEEDVRNAATLSRIHLKDEEVPAFTKNLESILSYVNKLEELDVTDIEPTSHVLSLKNVYREDIIKPHLTQAQALKIAVEQKDGGFKVPKIIE
ncbi:MAG: aspartyl-tRNA(Asn)/glutamyl-tRNA(Gln) amidotransferase subunit C [Lysobacterales bacterium]|jgi:aspartyl-tRNA(Asn)/glutamyl-tRNA(Gln) amidotransferase subunit C